MLGLKNIFLQLPWKIWTEKQTNTRSNFNNNICSPWEDGETQKCGKGKESIKDQPPATLDRVDYLGKRLYQADREMARMFGDNK